MAATSNVNIRMDEDLKRQAEQLFAEFGMNMTTAFTIFAKTVVRERRIPFEIAAPADDFFNDFNQARLIKAAVALNKSQEDLVIKTIEELESMENE